MKKRKKGLRIRYSYLIYIVAFFIILYIIFQILNVVKKRSELSNEFKKYTTEYNLKEEKYKELQDKKEKELSEEEIEKIAREKLNLKKQGERVFKIIGDKLEETTIDKKPLTDEEKEQLEEQIKNEKNKKGN